jgi:mono/diheme cytochrome c family protein
MKQHPFPTFGCTTCHYGSGRDLVQDAAHGDPDKWLSPMLPAKYMQAACAQCHTTYDPKTYTMSYLPQMTVMARGEKLFKDQACYGCHKIEGFSKGNVGPELTNEGRTAVVTTIAHQLWDPRYKVGSCVMPYFFSVKLPVKDDHGVSHIVDPRSEHTQAAAITDPDTLDSLSVHGYIPDQSREADVDALVTFVTAQTGQNYTASQSGRLAMISAFNASNPGEVPVTLDSGKHLFETSGCYACHHIGDPDFKGNALLDPKGKGGVAGPNLTWEGTRHSREWLIAHYANPQDFVPGSIMPIFPFSDSQRAALSLYDQSLRSTKSGTGTVSADVDMPSADQVKLGAKTRDIRYMTR